jgi:periplasmic divalent cation tolerance protein
VSEIVLVLTTWPADFDAGALARTLVSERLAACVTILPPVRSVYTWDGATQDDVEQQLVIKTTRDGVDGLWQAVKARHPYAVPEFLVLPAADGNPDYLEWVSASVRSRDSLT